VGGRTTPKNGEKGDLTKDDVAELNILKKRGSQLEICWGKGEFHHEGGGVTSSRIPMVKMEQLRVEGDVNRAVAGQRQSFRQ